MKKLLLLTAVILMGCSAENEKDCKLEKIELQNIREAGWQNCNGSQSCIKNVEETYQKRIKELNCN